MTELRCQSLSWKKPSFQEDGLSWITNSEENKAPHVAVLTLEEASVLNQNEWHESDRDKESNDRSLKRILTCLCLDSIGERNRLESVTIEDDEAEAGPEQQPLGEDLLLSLQDLLFGHTHSPSPAKEEDEAQRDSGLSTSTHEGTQKSIPLMHEVVLAESGIAMFSSQKLTLKTGSEDSAETGGHASAPSSTSHVSNEFLNSSFAFHQFDCHSDCTESTGTEGVVTHLNGSIGFNRRRLRSGDTVCSEISCGESWEANSSLFGREKGPLSQSQSQSHSQSQAQSYVLPSPPEASPPASRRPKTIPEAKETMETSVNQSSSSGAPTISNMVMSQSRDHPDPTADAERRTGIAIASLLTSIHSVPLSPSEASQEDEDEAADDAEEALMGVSLHSAIVSRALPASELGLHRPDSPPHSPVAAHGDMAGIALEEPSDLSDKTTSPHVTTAPASPDRQPASPPANKSSQGSGDSTGESAECLDVLVLPTMLPAPVRYMIYAALGVLQVDVRRAHSTATALVSCFLCTREGRQILSENDGSARILVLESSEGFVCASVVAVSSPLDAALPGLATAANTPLNSTASASASEPNSTTGAGAATVAGAASTSAGAATAVTEQGGLEASPRGGEMRLKSDLAARSVVLRVESCVWSTYDTSPPPTPVQRAGSGEYVDVPEPETGPSTSARDAVGEREIDIAGDAGGNEGLPAEENRKERRREASAAAPRRVVDMQAALKQVAKLVMLQQASLHSPFARAMPGGPSPAATAERRCYSSFELDCRLYGNRAATQLRDQQQARVEAQFKEIAVDAGAEGDSSCDQEGGEFSAACPPVPVLDAVLFRPGVELPVQPAGESGEPTLWKQLQPYLRRSAERDAQAGEEGMSAWDACRSQITVEGSFIAVRPRQKSPAGEASQRGEEPVGPEEQLYRMPADAVLEGARMLGAIPSDSLRIHECSRVTECDRGRAVSQPAIGVVVRWMPVGDAPAVNFPLRVQPTETVFWLFNPAAAPTSAADVVVTRSDRDFCLALYAASTTSTAQEGEGIVVHAAPCRVSRRTCPIKPGVAVAAFVQRPPADNACVVQSSLASHAADWVQSAGELVCGPAPRTMAPALTAISAPAAKVPPLQLENLGAGLVLAGDFSPPALPADTAEPSRASAGVVMTGWVLGAYAAMVQTIRYLIFPAATYYIQYYQADACVSLEPSGGDDASRHAAVFPAGAGHPAAGQWELLVISKPSADEKDEGEYREPAPRVIKAIPLSSAPTYCDVLMEQETGAAEKAAFPSCVVSLSAVNSASTRVLSVKRMSGGAIAETPMLTEQQKRRRSRRASSGQTTNETKRQFVELTAGARDLLQRRIHLQKHVQTVRTMLRVVVFVVLFAMSALLLAALVLDDAHPSEGPPASAIGPLPISQVAMSPALPTEDVDHKPATIAGIDAPDSYCPQQKFYTDASYYACLAPAESQPLSVLEPSCDANATEDGEGSMQRTVACLQWQTDIEECHRGEAARLHPPVCMDSCFNGSAVASEAPGFVVQERLGQPIPVPVTALPADARGASGESLHHLMTQYQLRQMRYRQSSIVASALPDAIKTEPGASPLREEFLKLYRALQVHVRAQRRYAHALTISAGRQLQISTDQVESQVAQAVGDVSRASVQWLDAVKQRLGRSLPVLAGTSEPGMVQRTSVGVARRVRRVQRALRRVSEITSTQAHTAYSAVTSSMHQAAEVILHNATAAVQQLYQAMVRIGQQVCQLNDQVCSWQDRVLHDAGQALRAALEKFAAAVDLVFGSV